jgi:hypothetical protein
MDLQKHWWIVPTTAGIIGVATLILAEQFFPNAVDFAVALLLSLVGLSFMWVFYARDVFWAVAPGVGCLTFVVIGIVYQFIPENNGWVATLMMSAGTMLIAAIPNRRPEMKVCYLIGDFILFIGILMMPVTLVWKVLLLVAAAAVTGLLVWRNYDTLRADFGNPYN